MAYKPLIVVDDDSPEVRRNFSLKCVKANVNVEVFETWDLTQEFIIEHKEQIDAVVLDAKGKLNADKGASEAHLFESHAWIKNLNIPYAIYTAYTEQLPMLEQQLDEGRVFTKGTHKEEDVLEYLKKEIALTPKLKLINQFPKPFLCFGGEYLNKQYESLLLNIIAISENTNFKDPEHLLFNPCRIILERIFEKITEVDEAVLPYALLNFERQRAGLVNCYKHLSGIPYYLNNVREQPSNFLRDTENELISKQLDIIITVCHPASHDIQKKYSTYTFKSVLWALFDVLIWLKEFIDKRS